MVVVMEELGDLLLEEGKVLALVLEVTDAFLTQRGVKLLDKGLIVFLVGPRGFEMLTVFTG